jgi:hypothetical protein
MLSGALGDPGIRAPGRAVVVSAGDGGHARSTASTAAVAITARLLLTMLKRACATKIAVQVSQHVFFMKLS